MPRRVTRARRAGKDFGVTMEQFSRIFQASDSGSELWTLEDAHREVLRVHAAGVPLDQPTLGRVLPLVNAVERSREIYCYH